MYPTRLVSTTDLEVGDVLVTPGRLDRITAIGPDEPSCAGPPIRKVNAVTTHQGSGTKVFFWIRLEAQHHVLTNVEPTP